MMTPFSIVVVTFTLTVVFFLFHFVWRDDLRVDLFRSRVFALRDEFFAFAADGHIAFDDPAYVLLRRRMNGFIRFGHELTLAQYIGITIAYESSSDFQEVAKEAREELSDAFESAADSNPWVKEQLDAFHMRLGFLVADHIVSSSLALTLFVWAIIAGVKSVWAIRGVAKKIVAADLLPKLSAVDARAAEVGAGC